MEEKRLTLEEETALLTRIYEGTPAEVNDAWQKIWESYRDYIRYLAYERLKNIELPEVISKADLMDDLEQAGWTGFCDSFLTYSPGGEAKLLTYAGKAMEREINKEFFAQMNTLGLADKPYRFVQRYSVDDVVVASKSEERSETVNIPKGAELGEFSKERQILQLIKVIHRQTDKDHTISIKELFELLKVFRKVEYGNTSNEKTETTLNKAFVEIVLELGSEKIHFDNDEDYIGKLKAKTDGVKVKYAPRGISGIYYDHPFDNDTLDKLVMLINYSDMFDAEEKDRIINELVATASRYYENPLTDGRHKGICGRYGRRDQISRNNRVIQDAINRLEQVSFYFNRFTEDGDLVHTTKDPHVISCYHVVLYHDNYYLIGMYKGDDHINHFRVDLMSDVKVLRGVPIELATPAALPLLRSNWDPGEYMAQHLYMGYDDPRIIRLKINTGDKRIYTTLHDWFDDHFAVTDEACDDGFKIVKVKTSSAMMVPFALQYSDRIEVLNEDIREDIAEKIRILEKKYSNQ
ncbi:MAG: WYL domain-containing protein [Saccharofermentans sp.]|nr:WYL domain-containing protein [Saccharofermentans sp.]